MMKFVIILVVLLLLSFAAY
ncbi:type I toxin-antitoxin system Ibs family toxin [Shigella flexneri]|nr:type I toxin-antitoxin system Ibs family toxin [Shigella flexneri]